MMEVDRDSAWTAVAGGAAMLGGAAVRKALEQGWKLVRHEDPPLDPSSREVAWRDAIIWTIATGVGIGLGRLIARRSAAAWWERITGDAPPF